MSNGKWYVEFEVEDEAAETRFWGCIEKIGENAKIFVESDDIMERNDASIALHQAAIDFAKEMKYI